jgi:hypothetical protein
MFAAAQGVSGQSSSERVVQPPEVIEAYRVCRQFQTLMLENLDFDRAFEATFAKDAKRRREIAITEGEFGVVDLTSVDDASLISAFKSRMEIFYLMLPLASPQDDEAKVFFPPRVKKIIDRKPSSDPKKFRAYSLQLKRDAAYLHAHLERLARQDRSVAERIREFKEGLSGKLEPPHHLVEPMTAYSRGRVLGLDEPYYRINEFAVIRRGRRDENRWNSFLQPAVLSLRQR